MSAAPEQDERALAIIRAAFDQARKGDTAALADSLDLGVPSDVCNERGDSLLMLAIYHGHLDVARLLLARGADPELRNGRGQTPLEGAAFKGDVASATLLLDHGAAADLPGPDGRTPLMYAAMFDQVGMVELLLARGASAHRRDAAGGTPYTLAQAMRAQRVLARLAALLVVAAIG